MLTSSRRFHGYSSLNYAYRQGESVRDPKMSLKFALNNRRHNYRVAVVVSRKVSRSAVVRNRIRRRVYEAIRTNPSPIKDSYDLIFSVHSAELAAMPSSELQNLTLGLLKRAKAV